MRRVPAAVLTGILALGAGSATAGPWGRPRGGVYAKTSYAYLHATDLATPDGTIASIPAFGKNEASLYVAYGLSDRVTLVLDAIAYRQSGIEGFDSAGGVGDVRVGVQARVGRAGPWVFAARGTLQAPTGDETRGEGLLPSGSGVWEGDLVASAGRSFGRGQGWLFVEAGPQFRGGGLREGLVYGAQVGWRRGRVLFMANLRGVQPWDSTPGDASAGSAAGLGDGVTYLAVGPSVAVEVGRGLGIQVDLDGATHARNLARGPTLRVGLYWSR